MTGSSSSTNEGPSIAAQVREYIDARPVVRDALSRGIVNLSALTREIVANTDLSRKHAVLAACRRYQESQDEPSYEEDIRDVLKRSKLEVRTQVANLTVTRSWSFLDKLQRAVKEVRRHDVPIHVLHGSHATTIITDEGFHEDLVDLVGPDDLINVREGLVEMSIKSPTVIEDTPGILAFLSKSLAQRGVSLVEAISCYEETIFLVEKDDLLVSFQTLDPLIGA